jgi:hypothetical protein
MVPSVVRLRCIFKDHAIFNTDRDLFHDHHNRDMFHDPPKGGSKQIQRDERSNNLTTSIINKQHNKEKQVFRPGLPNPWLQFIESSRRRQLVFTL